MGTQVKPVVKTSTMEQELQDEVIAVAQVAMSTETNEQEIAAKVKQHFEQKYHGLLWHCCVGRNVACYVTHEQSKFLYFYIGQMAVGLCARNRGFPMSLKLYAEIPYKLVRKRSHGPVLSTPPPLPLIALSPDDEWEEFDTATQTGFGYALPYLPALDEPDAHKHAERGSVAVPPEAPRRSRLLSEYMTNNEFFQSPRHGFGTETRLIYKRNKELESGSIALIASMNRPDEARFLRHHFVFKVVPMLNPDGVVHGNYRCSLAGTDLNRRWLNPSSELHPTIFATKNMLLSVCKIRPVSLYCDLHGHSRKKNIFLYGCRPFDPGSRTEAARVRLFPHILCKTSDCTRGGFYSFGDCTFSINASKKGTGRVVVWNEMKVLHSFTIEASFFGVDTTVQKAQLQTAPNSRVRLDFDLAEQLNPSLRHFTPADLHMAGIKLCHALLPYSQVLMLQRANTLTLPISPKLPSTPPRSTRAEQDEVSGHPRQRALDFEPPIPVKCFGPIKAANDFASNSKIRLAPLEVPLALPKEQDGPMSWMEPQRPASPLLDPVSLDRGTENSESFSFGPPPEFDQLFAGEDVSVLSLLDHDDLIREIEAALPDNFQDNSEEDGSVGFESDPSGDTTEDEDKEGRQKTPPKSIIESPAIEAEPVKLAEPVLTRNRPPRVTRHLSEPRLLEAIVPKQAPSQPEATPAAAVMIRVKPSTLITSKPAPSLAPLRKEAPTQRIVVCQNMPYDRNREIATMHLHAVQKRSKTRRNIRQATLEMDGS
ncbi:hypothetical protein PF006_g2306 [Phytophthora fragariae]|uniref:Dynein light chain 1, cytoplasmic n=1 Tax=Phytophthora fragariae TaxID=53985 RepID=A0A6A3USE8_9STRA|nr:hypothetical protein PF006_g2306 [Phytophthora fragariae]